MKKKLCNSNIISVLLPKLVEGSKVELCDLVPAAKNANSPIFIVCTSH